MMRYDERKAREIIKFRDFDYKIYLQTGILNGQNFTREIFVYIGTKTNAK